MDRARLACACLTLGLVTSAANAWPPGAPEIAVPATLGAPTRAEASAFRATSTHAEVVTYLDALAAKYPDRCARLTMGSTTEGREIPVVILSNPRVSSAKEAMELSERDGRARVLLFGNIHAGEVDAKEAMQMLARDLLASDSDLLKELVIAIAPIYNCDGNERFGETATHRPGQVGPDDGCGIRHNAMDLDLNRDFGKLEAPETRALVGFMNEWDPHVVVDGHTTNGSNHRYLMTTAGPKMPAGDAEIVSLWREKLYPSIGARYAKKTARELFWYGSYEGEYGQANRTHTRWETFPAEMRYGTNAIGLRGRIGILSESYSYATFKDRILGTYAFCDAILEDAAAMRKEIRAATANADARALRGEPSEVAIRTRASAWPEKVTVKGFMEVTENGRSRSTGEPAEYSCELLDKFEPTLSVTRPEAYALLVDAPEVLDVLRMQGVKVEVLKTALRVEAEVYRVETVAAASRLFQGHALVRIDAARRNEKMELPAGTPIVRTKQLRSNLIVFMLEPQSEDGLATWNFFDRWARVGSDFPVVRLPRMDGD